MFGNRAARRAAEIRSLEDEATGQFAAAQAYDKAGNQAAAASRRLVAAQAASRAAELQSQAG